MKKKGGPLLSTLHFYSIDAWHAVAGEDNEEKGQDTSEGGDDGMRLKQEEVGEWAASGSRTCRKCKKVNDGKSIFIFDKIIWESKVDFSKAKNRAGGGSWRFQCVSAWCYEQFGILRQKMVMEMPKFAKKKALMLAWGGSRNSRLCWRHLLSGHYMQLRGCYQQQKLNWPFRN